MYEPVYKLTRTADSTLPQIVKLINKEYVERQTIFGMTEKMFKVFNGECELNVV